MELAASICIERLEPEHPQSGLRNLKDPLRVKDEEVSKVITITKNFQTKIGLRMCHKLTQEVFDRLGECPFLRYCDLLSTSCASISSLQSCSRLLELNIRYTKVSDLTPITTLSLLRKLDAGACYNLRDCTCLANLGTSIKELYIDDTECDSIDEVATACTELTHLNAHFTNIPPSLRPNVQMLMKPKSRSYLFFKGVMDKRPDKLGPLVKDGLNVNSRPHHKFGGEGSYSDDFYVKECNQATRFFKFDHPNKPLRPTALHVACFNGDVDTVKELVALGANPKLRCWFGKHMPYNGQLKLKDMDATPADVVRVANKEQIYRKILKMLEQDVMDWKEKCLAKQHELLCALEGLDPAEVEVEQAYDD
mmetsp:Transcript_969/g.1740  ORF Transcript_969/g.1740 Transcript_969/m.1740 type:complete len:365 (+) Transcript_969:156-1250(+)